eukprot:184233-Rhodomonas_salina.1
MHPAAVYQAYARYAMPEERGSREGGAGARECIYSENIQILKQRNLPGGGLSYRMVLARGAFVCAPLQQASSC